jgi:glycosyltransferase involved in cell wall biosynthesis
MKHLWKNPEWIDSRLISTRVLNEIPQSLFDEINDGLAALQHNSPLVSIIIPAFNEEVTILETLYSLSKNKTTYPVEIIVVDNNSTDRTSEVLSRLKVRSVFQSKAGWGPARQKGQESAKGNYVLMADADCFYPPRWIQRMTTELMRDGVTCVYGGYSFLAPPGKSRLKFFVYESLRNVIVEVRHIKRPWFNCMGMCMGYVRELGLKIGFIDRKIRGEDGRMCFELAQHGRIVRVRSSDVTVWTFPRTLQKDGNLFYSILNRAVIELARFRLYLYKQPAHDTHNSANFVPPSLPYFKKSAMPDEKADEVKT